jgi:hypothetical protein
MRDGLARLLPRWYGPVCSNVLSAVNPGIVMVLISPFLSSVTLPIIIGGQLGDQEWKLLGDIDVLNTFLYYGSIAVHAGKTHIDHRE